MRQPNQFRENAENCAELAMKAPNEPSKARYKRMEAAWLALAQEQDWLDGEIDPARSGINGDAGDIRSPNQP